MYSIKINLLKLNLFNKKNKLLHHKRSSNSNILHFLANNSQIFSGIFQPHSPHIRLGSQICSQIVGSIPRFHFPVIVEEGHSGRIPMDGRLGRVEGKRGGGIGHRPLSGDQIH